MSGLNFLFFRSLGIGLSISVVLSVLSGYWLAKEEKAPGLVLSKELFRRP
jgi:hypothetical protein